MLSWSKNIFPTTPSSKTSQCYSWCWSLTEIKMIKPGVFPACPEGRDMIKIFCFQHVWDIKKKMAVCFRRAPWDLQAEKGLADQEESRWVIFNHSPGCLTQTEDRRSTVSSRLIDMDSKWHSSRFSPSLIFSLFFSFPFAYQGKQGEPGPSGKAGVPGSPVSRLVLPASP